MLVRSSIVRLLFGTVLVASASIPAWSQAATPADGPWFGRHVIDDQFENGYQVSVADIDLDGLPDVIALATDPSKLVWYKNPSWERFTVTTRGQLNIDVAPYDVDGDGDTDLALASEFRLGESTSGGDVYWFECPRDPKNQQEWEMHFIDAVPTSHRVRWADTNGDGKRELLNLPIVGIGAKAPDYTVGVQFKAYTIPADPRNAAWKATIIDDALHMSHGICVVQWDDDGREDILTASFIGVNLFQCPRQALGFAKRQLGLGHAGPRPAQGSSEVGVGILQAPPGRFVATIEPWHGNEVVVYSPKERKAFPWTRTVVDDTFKDGHGLVCVDVDRDGNDEIVAGHRGPDYSLYMYRYAPDRNAWDRTAVDQGGISVAGLAVADLNGDGFPDILSTGSATNNVVWYANLAGKR